MEVTITFKENLNEESDNDIVKIYVIPDEDIELEKERIIKQYNSHGFTEEINPIDDYIKIYVNRFIDNEISVYKKYVLKQIALENKRIERDQNINKLLDD